MDGDEAQLTGGVVTRKKTSIVRTAKGYDAVLADVVALIDAGRRAVVRSSNAIMTMTYWAVGQRIVEEEQRGEARAGYGEVLVSRLAVDLTTRFGRGFGQRNVFNMRAFYLSHRDTILQTACKISVRTGTPEIPDAVWRICRR